MDVSYLVTVIVQPAKSLNIVFIKPVKVQLTFTTDMEKSCRTGGGDTKITTILERKQ